MSSLATFGLPVQRRGQLLAKVLAETIWRQILNADGWPWSIVEINKAATVCYEHRPPE